MFTISVSMRIYEELVAFFIFYIFILFVSMDV